MSKKIYFSPGPSQLYYTYEDHLKSAIRKDLGSISHRSANFIEVVQETTEALKELLGLPHGYHVFFLNSANEAWDRIVQNLITHKSHHFTNGSFSKKFHDFAIQYGMESSYSGNGDGQAFDLTDVPSDTELIGITKNETSVGYQFTHEEMVGLRSAHPDKLIALDMVSAAPAVPIDFSQVDTAYLSVQKAFGMPPGLGIWIVNDRCVEKAKEVAAIRSIGSYRSVLTLKKFADKHQTPETPNMINIYILGEIAKDLIRYGKERIYNDTKYKAAILRQLEGHMGLSNFVKTKEHQSLTTLVFQTERAEEIKKSIAKKGMILGGGYGPYKSEHIRIANFPAHSKESIELLFDQIMNLK